MYTALAVLLTLVSGQRPRLPDVCELRKAISNKASSRSCISCHDGTIGPVADVRFVDVQPQGSSFLETYAGLTEGLASNGTHPVDVDYAAAEVRRPGTLTPMAALPQELVLRNGQVTCVTCHNPKSRERFHVSLTVERSALCFACHKY